MANSKRFWLGIPVVALVFVMMVIGCDSGSNSEINYLATLNLSTGNPDAAALSAGGLNQVQFNEIRDAASGSFRGWHLNEDGELEMYWTDRSESNFDSVADALKALFGEKYRGSDEGKLYADSDYYFITLYTHRTQYDGKYLPAGTMQVGFY
ncbi:MAG: hypothetical protein FWG99_02995 [Treponema sp.]|nr:hypothetical protein [Treponema sp.]